MHYLISFFFASISKYSTRNIDRESSTRFSDLSPRRERYFSIYVFSYGPTICSNENQTTPLLRLVAFQYVTTAFSRIRLHSWSDKAPSRFHATCGAVQKSCEFFHSGEGNDGESCSVWVYLARYIQVESSKAATKLIGAHECFVWEETLTVPSP